MTPTHRHTALLLAAFLLVLNASVLAQTAETAYDHPLFTGPSHEASIPRFDQEHLRLALRLDLDARRVFGDARLRMRPPDATTDSLLLFATGLEIDSVLIGAAASAMIQTPFRIGDADTLVVRLDSLLVPGAPFEVRLFYHAQPRRGLFFIQPSRDHPNQKRQVWTVNAPGATRHWLPVHDAPGDLLTSEVLITADSSLQVLSNGRRVEATDNDDGTVTTYFRQDQPHSPHRLMLAVGDYEVRQNTARFTTNDPPVTLSYWTYPEHIGEVARTFDRTPAMMSFFAERLNVPFPWHSYDQAILRQLHRDRQAHAGVALFADPIMLDERAALSENADAMIAEALARQWFGSVVTARYWTDAWLDEGFAAYLSALFTEHHEGEDAFALTMQDYARRYLDEAQHYRRPLVWHRWEDPAMVFDAHSAQKGAWVLHMLRRRLGDERFWTVLEQYLTTYAFQPVETTDLKRVVEQVADENFDAFFAQWTEAAGHPVLDARYTYDAEAGALSVVVTQQQAGYLVPEAFQIPLTLEAHTLSERFRFEVTLEANSQVFTLPLTARPRFLLVDPDQALLAEVQLTQTARAWVGQLRQAPDAVNRIQAAHALAAFGDDPALLIGLRTALRDETSAAVRKAIAETLGQLPSSTAIQRLLMNLMTDENASVRAATLDALSVYENADVQDLAFEAAQNDPSYLVQATAVKTLARTAAPTALDVVRSALITPSHREVIRRAAFEALPLLDLPARDAVALGLEYSTADQPASVRIAAIHYVQSLAGEARTALNRLIALLDDEDIRVRRAAIESLGLVGSEQARTALKQHQPTEPEPLLQALLNQVLRQGAATNN